MNIRTPLNRSVLAESTKMWLGVREDGRLQRTGGRSAGKMRCAQTRYLFAHIDLVRFASSCAPCGRPQHTSTQNINAKPRYGSAARHGCDVGFVGHKVGVSEKSTFLSSWGTRSTCTTTLHHVKGLPNPDHLVIMPQVYVCASVTLCEQIALGYCRTSHRLVYKIPPATPR
jgi:hypothetical protein